MKKGYFVTDEAGIFQKKQIQYVKDFYAYIFK